MRLSSADFFFIYFKIKFQGKESYLPQMLLTFANSIVLSTYFGSSLVSLLYGLSNMSTFWFYQRKSSLTIAYPVAFP